MKITTKVQKTIQESNYEPIMVSCEIEKEVKDYEAEDELKEIREMVLSEVKTTLKEWPNAS